MIDENQVYVVVDIEADGPAPGLNSMLSLAAVATTPELEVAQFYRKLMPLKDAKPDSSTVDWWKVNSRAWEEVCKDQEPVEKVIGDFCLWVKQLDAEAIFVASPIGLDYSFVSWYLFRFAPENPFMNEKHAIRTLDIRSFIAGKYGLSFNDSSRLRLPTSLTKGMPAHTHRAIDDAVGYAYLLRKIVH